MALAPVDEGMLRQRERLRELLIFKTFHALADGWTTAERDTCQINRQILHELSKSYWLDIDRKKAFHDINFADEHKRAGYSVKWIMRFRPVQLLSENVTRRVLLANERLAFTVAMRKLNIRPSDVPDALIENLLYTFRFRHLDGNALAMSFFLMQQRNRR